MLLYLLIAPFLLDEPCETLVVWYSSERVYIHYVCHINKHKDDVLTRFDEFARSPHGRVMIANYSRPSTEFESVTEMRTASATVLTTRIKDKTTTALSFRAAADRLIKLLLEEALVSCGSATVLADSITSQGIESLTMDSTPCAVALERDGNMMFNLFKQMEPEAATGSIRGTDTYGESPKSSNWQVLTVDLPATIASTSVLLLIPVFSSASFACAAIEELRVRGVLPSSICIVCVSCSFEAARDMSTRHPDVNIITAALDKPTTEPSESLDDFLHRYYASTTETCEPS